MKASSALQAMHKPGSMKYKQYNPTHGNLVIEDMLNCMEDSKGRLWAISNSGGLFIYNKEKDQFEPKNRDFHLKGERALAINEDKFGNLWITTDRALALLVWGSNPNTPKEIIYFGKEDGLGDILFSANSTFKYKDELFFGGKTNFFSFFPTKTSPISSGARAN